MNKTFHLSFDVLLVAGMQSKYLGDTVNIHKQLAPGLCSMIKVEEVSEPLHETPGKTAEAVLLFCQVVQTGQAGPPDYHSHRSGSLSTLGSPSEAN